jgi:hypothetical protein
MHRGWHARSSCGAYVARCLCHVGREARRASGVCKPGSKTIAPFLSAALQNQLRSWTSGYHSSPWTMGTSFPLETTTSRSRTVDRSYPRARLGSTRVHRGKCMPLRVSICSDRRCLGRCHCMRLGRRRFGWGCPFGSHRRGFACRMDRTRLRRVSRLGGGR